MFSGGFVGVDIFFVISGYLITGILAREITDDRFSIVGFYERRARRILPALVVVILACLIGGLFLLTPEPFADLAKSAIATMLFSSNIWFWHSSLDYFSAGVAVAPLLHTWSLAVEEQFYLFFPLLLFALGRFSRTVNVAIVALLSLLSLALSIVLTDISAMTNFFLLPTRIWELGAGALLALLPLRLSLPDWLVEGLALAGLIMVVGSIFLLTETTPFPGLTAVPVCLGSVLLIWSGQQPRPTMVSRLLSMPILVGIGLISYSLYLWHWPVIVAARLWTGEITLSLPLAWVCIVLSIALAYLSWRFVEAPFRRPNSGLRLARAGIFKLSAAGMAAITALSVAIVLLNGLPSRLAPDVRQAYLEASENHPLVRDCLTNRVGTPPCQIGAAKDGPPDFAIWGDSHAGALLAGLDHWLTAQGYSGVTYTKAACPPVPGLRRADLSAGHGCDRQNDFALNELLSLPDTTRIIIAARWPLAVEGARVRNETGGPPVLADATGVRWDRDTYPQNIEARVGAALDKLSGHDILLIGGVPELGQEVPTLYARGAMLGRNILPQMSREQYLDRNGRSIEMLRNLADKAHVRFADTTDTFCPDECLIEIDGDLLYYDEDHLSRFGSIWLMDPILTAAFGQTD